MALYRRRALGVQLILSFLWLHPDRLVLHFLALRFHLDVLVYLEDQVHPIQKYQINLKVLIKYNLKYTAHVKRKDRIVMRNFVIILRNFMILELRHLYKAKLRKIITKWRRNYKVE